MKHSLDLCLQIHAANKAKGFWDVPRPANETLMLVICELAEAVEADRAGRRFSDSDSAWHYFLLSRDSEHSLLWHNKFKICVKDTVEDELADAYIRICDLIGSYGPDSAFSEIFSDFENVDEMAFIEGQNSFCQDMFDMTHSVMVCHTDYLEHDVDAFSLCICLENLRLICDKYNIDLESHVKWKLQYNAGRPAKHGKSY